MSLTREQIRSVDKVVTQRVDVPEWGDCVYLRVMSGSDREYFEISSNKFGPDGKRIGPEDHIQGRLLALTLCDKDGSLLYGRKDYAEIGGKNGIAIRRLFNEARKLNNMDDEAIERAEKNSEQDQNGVSGSGSPGTSDAA